MKNYYVYIVSSQKNGTLYVGVTNNLAKRVYEHKKNLISGFTEKYKVHNLVYFEKYNDIDEAILREKRIKRWKRNWKIKLIEKNNPEWEDIYHEIIK